MKRVATTITLTFILLLLLPNIYGPWLSNFSTISNLTVESNNHSSPLIYDEQVLNILYPRNSRPEIRKNNEPFMVAVNVTGNPSNWIFQISSIAGVFNLTVINNTQDGTIWIFWVKAVNVECALYNLTVIVTIDTTTYFDTEPRAISIIEEYPESYNFIVINDFRITDNAPDRAKALIESINQINMIRPTFVLVIGDLVNSGYTETEEETAQQYAEFYSILQKFEVPTFVISGNHEYYNDGIKYYDKYFGYWPSEKSDEQYHNYTFVFGNAVFVFVDTGEGGRAVAIKNSQIQWVENQFMKYQNKPLKFLIMHVPVFDGTGDDRCLADISKYAFIDIVDTYNITLVLSGHTHVDKMTIYHDHIYLETTSVGAPARTATGVPDYAPHWGYRLIEIRNNSVTKFSYDETGHYSIPVYIDEEGKATPYVATPIFNVTYKFSDIWHYYNIAKIRSNLSSSMLVWVKFVFPKLYDGMNIDVTNGLDYKIFTFGDRTYIYVLANMTPGVTEVKVEITPTPSTPTIRDILYELKKLESGWVLQVNVTIDDDYGILNVSLFYEVDGVLKVENMTLLSDGNYTCSTEPFNATSEIIFWVKAVNVFGMSVESEQISILVTEEIPWYYSPLFIYTTIGIVVVIVIVVSILYIKKQKRT